MHVLRDGDLYLLMSASGAGLRGRGSHAHNDALSLEVSACGADFIVDPGTYVYTRDARARHEFRSTAWHSAVEIDGREQNTTDERAPFRIGDEARPRLLRFTREAERDSVSAEHHGYERLADPITHARAVTLDKRARLFLVEDSFSSGGVRAAARAQSHAPASAGARAQTHTFRFFFHAGRAVSARVREHFAELYDEQTGARLLIVPFGIDAAPSVEPRATSRDYGERAASRSLCWTVEASAPLKVVFALVPVCAGEDEAERLKALEETMNREGR